MFPPLLLFLDPATIWQWISALLGLIILVGSAAIILLSKRREDVHATDLRNVSAQRGLIETRDLQLTDAKMELDTITSEYKTLVQIYIKELVQVWQSHLAAHYYVENGRLRAECDELKARLARYEKV